MKIYRYILFLLVTTPAFAQLKNFTIQDALIRNRTTLAPTSLRQLQFMYGKEDYVYLKKDGKEDVWVSGNFNTGEKPFLTLAQLNERMRKAGRDTFSAMPLINFSQSTNWLISSRNGRVLLDPTSGKVQQLIDSLTTQQGNVAESKTGLIAFTKDHNLYINYGTYTKQVTTDGSSDIVYASSVHRDEFGIQKGTFWSNNGKKLAFYRMDQSMVTGYPIINWDTKPATVEMIKYPMAGDKSHHVKVGVYDSERGDVVYLKTGEPAEQYLTNVTWSPDDRYVFIAIVNRAQDHVKVNQYHAATGELVKTVFEEMDSNYVEPQVPLLFFKNDPSRFVWQSFRDGWNHLYLYDTTGRMIRQLTSGKWNVVDVKGWDEKGENLYYISTQESPITRHLYKLAVPSGKVTRITSGEAVHNAIVSPSGKWVLDVASSPANPRQFQLIETATGKSKTIFNAPDPLQDYNLGRMEIFTIPNKEGEPLYCRLFKPVGFDSTKTYPVIVYWYGGSHAQLITAGYNGGASDYWFQAMAQRGFVVFSIDVRGSANRGMAFEQASFRQAGKPQMEDLMSGVDFLHQLPYVDKNNMGLFGWSYGGFLTINTMLTYPNVFKAAVAGGPVTDWSLYEVMYTERYMDTPQENSEGYAATNLSRRIDQLKGKLLLIHGLQDPVVVQQHSVQLVKAAIDNNVQVDYMIYPGHGHNVIGKDRAHLYQKVTDYLELHLKK